MSQNLENFAKFQKFQLGNLVDLEKCCQTRIYMYLLAKFRFDTAENERKFAENLPTICRTSIQGSIPVLSQYPPAGGQAKLWRARSRLYRSRFLQVNMRFAAFFKIYQIIKLNFLKFGNILQFLQFLRHLQKFC